MINKFKDFLKKLSGKRNQDLSDQDELLDEEISDDSLQQALSNREDKTGETPLPDLTPNWKDKLRSSLSNISLRKKKTSDLENEDTTTPEKTSSFGDRFKFTIPHFKDFKLPVGMKNTKSETFSLSPSLSKSIEKFLSREARETIHQVSLVVFVCGITYTMGKMTALGLKGQPSTGSDKDFTVNIDLENDFNAATLGQVKSINIFRTNTGLGGKKKLADTKCEEAQSESGLPIKLVNTVVLQDTVKSLASVQVRGERLLQEVRVGDQIGNLAKIFKITRLELLVKNLESGTCESIASEKSRESKSPISVMSASESRDYKANKKMAGIENVGNKFNISKALLDTKMKDIANIVTQARAIPINNPDGTISFKLTEMEPESIYSYLGLQDQDMITSINGKPIYNMNEVMSLFSRVKNLDKLQLGVKREGSETVLDYNIKK